MGKFINLYESAIQRFTRGGFLTGDLVKFKTSYKGDDFFKQQSPNYLQKIEDFIKSGLNIRVSAIKPLYPSLQSGNIQNEAVSFLIDVVLEKAPGLYYDFVTVPASVLEHIDTGINLAPVPDELKYDDKIQIEPQELTTASSDTYQSPIRQTRTTDLGDVKDSKSETVLTRTNKRIPSTPADKERDPANSTARYLKGLA
jgi:hypothetical protein